MPTAVQPTTPAASSPARPSTPASRSLPQSTPTGTWRHPRFDEIARRQNAGTFSDRNVKRVLYNIAIWVALWLGDRSIFKFLPVVAQSIVAARPYSTYAYYLLTLMFVYNIVGALMPLLRPIDDLSDIPLTPAQRKLLGLTPLATPPTAGSKYITPPRYSRSTTPMSASPSSNYSQSPLSGKDGAAHASTRGSPFSPSSPLLHKAIGGLGGASRRLSYGSPSPLGPGTGRGDGPGTPSPSGNKNASVGLNNKWLYERGRGSPGQPRLFS